MEEKSKTGLVLKELAYEKNGEEKIPMIPFENIKKLTIKKTIFGRNIEIEFL